MHKVRLVLTCLLLIANINMGRFNDLESGFEKTLALSYGRHIITGHPIEHSVGLEGGASTDIPNADKRVVLKVALGDGAPDEDGEGAWCGPSIVIGGDDVEGSTGIKADDWSDISFHLALEDAGAGIEFVSESHANFPANEVDAPADIEEGDFLLAFINSQASASGLLVLTPPAGWTVVYQPVFTPSDVLWVQVAWKIAGASEPSTYEWGDNIDSGYKDTHGGEQLSLFVVAYRGVNEDTPIRDSAKANVLSDDLWDFEATSNPLYALPSITADASDLLVGVALSLHQLAGNYLPVTDGYQEVAGYTSRFMQPDGPLVAGAVAPAIIIEDKTASGGGGGSDITISPGEPCSMEVIYAGETIPPESWHFHPGTLSRGKDDPIQGVDAFFPNGLTYNATAYITVVLPDGIDEDADASKLVVLIYTSQVADYDEAGVRTAIAYSPSPARVKANMLRRIGQHQRIYWPSYTHSRDYYDTEIEAPVSNQNSYDDFDDVPSYEVFGPVEADAGTGAIDRTGGSGYDNRAVTQQRIVGGEEGGFSATLGSSFDTGTGGGEMALIDEHGTIWFGISWGNGHLGVYANETGIEDPTDPYDLPADGGDVIELNVAGGNFILKQNGVTKAIPQGAAPAPAEVDLFGRIILWAPTAEITASNFTGQVTTDQTVHTEMVKRFEAHPAFTGPTDIGTALDFVDFLCASETQDAGRYIVFLTPEERASVHTFDDETNVVGRTVKVYPTDIRNRPSRLWAKYRNLDLRYLDQDSVFDLRDALFDKVGRPIDPGPLNFGSMRTSQAQRLIRFEMRRRSDNKIWCELTGMDDSFHVLPGDVVTVVSRKFGRVPKDFMVISATRESPEALPGGLQRNFVLQEYFGDDYRDDDHEVPQTPAAAHPPSTFSAPGAPVLVLEREVLP